MRAPAKNNWRLGYVLDGGVVLSDIYWPYQVRSFDAIRTDFGYDVIALVTDLPPIADYSVTANKLTKTEQRVQGIVLFKFNHTTKTWSDHSEFDIADNHTAVVRANVKLTKHADRIYMVYAKEYSDQVGLALTQSADGLSWEDPIFYTGLGEFATVGDVPRACLVRASKYMYLVTGDGVMRSVATAFMGTPDPSVTQDITDYVTGVSVTIGQARSASVNLGDPNGELSAGLMGKYPLALKATLKVGYHTDNGDVTIPCVTGYVVDRSTDTGLPVRTMHDLHQGYRFAH